MVSTPEYWRKVRERAKELKSDGCSGVLDIYVDACYEHDIHYRTHRRIDGTPITRSEADELLKQRIREFSPLDGASPMALWRWAVVRLVGWWAWWKNGRKLS